MHFFYYWGSSVFFSSLLHTNKRFTGTRKKNSRSITIESSIFSHKTKLKASTDFKPTETERERITHTRKEKCIRLSRFVKWAENLKSLASPKCRLKLAGSIRFGMHWTDVCVCVCVFDVVVTVRVCGDRKESNERKKRKKSKVKCHMKYLSHETISFHFVEHFQRKNKHKGFGVKFFAI